MKKQKKQKFFLFLLATSIGVLVSFLIYSCKEPLCVVPSSDNNRGLPKNALIDCNELPNIFDTKQNVGSILAYKQYYDNEGQSIFTLANLYDKYLFSISGGELANSKNKIQAIRIQVTLSTIDTTNADSSDEKAYTIPIPIINGAIDASNTTASLQTVNNVRTLFFGLTDDLQNAIKAISTETFKISIDYTIQYTDNAIEDKKSKSFEITKKPFTDIYTWQDLQAIMYDVTKSYTIQDNITFPEAGTKGFPSTGFIPIGDTNSPFTGSLDGGGNTISGLFIENTANNANIGLFGVISGSSTIENITFSEVNLIASATNTNVGALAGKVMGGTLTGIKVQSGTIEGTNAGGLIGTIDTIDTTTTVKLVGFNSDDSKADTATARKNSGATITAVANGSIGGLVGAIVADNPVTINNPVTIIGYSTATVQGSTNSTTTGTNIGGLIGSVSGSTEIKIDGYTYGKVKSTSENDYTGGVLGVNNNANLLLRAISYSTVLGIKDQNNLGWLIGANSANNVTGYWLNTQGVSDGFSPSKAIGTNVQGTISEIDNTSTFDFSNFIATNKNWTAIDSALPILQYPENSPNFFGNQPFLPSYTNNLTISYRTGTTPPLTRGAFYDSDSFTISNDNIGTQTSLELQLRYSYTTNANSVVASSDSYTTTLASSTDNSNSITFGLQDFTNANTLLSTALYKNLSEITNITFTFIITENSTNTYRGKIEIPVNANAIYTATDLQSMQHKLDAEYKLYNDIALENKWTPIGNVKKPFKGSLQGWDSSTMQSTKRTISNFSISNITSNPVGLFGVINNTSNTDNTAIENISITLKADTSCDSLSKECAIYNSADASVGVFVGILQAGHLKDLTITATQISTIYSSSATGFVGGFIGEMQSGTSATNLQNLGVAIFTNATGIGGLVGKSSDSATITGSVDSSTVTGATNATGIGGLVGKASDSATITGSVDSSTITGATNAGGLVGKASDSATIVGSVNLSTITGATNAGGLVGYTENTVTIKDSSVANTTINDNAGGIGGLVGVMLGTADTYTTISNTSISNTSIKDSTIQDSSTSNVAIGGLVGIMTYGSLSLDNTSSNISIIGGANSTIGGVIGILKAGTLENLTNSFVNSITTDTNNACVSAGGLIGNIAPEGPVTVTGKNTLSLDLNCETVGGLIGEINQDNEATIRIVGQNSSSIKATTHVGGLIGYINSTQSSINITGFSGAPVTEPPDPLSIIATGETNDVYVGGLIGYLKKTDANNTASMSLYITGYSNSTVFSSDYSPNNQNQNQNQNVGGLVGYVEVDNITLDGYSAGDVHSAKPNNNNLGGIIGYMPSGTLWGNSYWKKVIEASSANLNHAAVVGNLDNTNMQIGSGSKFEEITSLSDTPIFKDSFYSTFTKQLPKLVDTTTPSFTFNNQPTIYSPLPANISVQLVVHTSIGPGIFLGEENLMFRTDSNNKTFRVKSIGIGYTNSTDYVLQENGAYIKTVTANEPFGIKIDTYPTQNPALTINGDFTKNTCGKEITIKVQYSEEGSTGIETIEAKSIRDCNINTENDLRGIAYDLTANYTLKENIVLSTEWEVLGPNTNTNSTSLPNKEDAFTGSLVSDTGNYTISNFFISNTADIPVGLFGIINSTEDPTLGGITIELAADGLTSAINNTADKQVGIFAGGLTDGVLKELTVKSPKNKTSSITSDGPNVGGIVGYIDQGSNPIKITNVFSDGVSITGAYYVGGLVGRFVDNPTNMKEIIITGKVENIAITADSYVGGLVGATNGGNTKIYGWVKDSTVTSTGTHIGGLVGQVASSTVKGYVIGSNANNKLNITGNNYVGGLVGQLATKATLEGYTHNLEASAKGQSFVGSFVGQIDNSKVDGFALNSSPSDISGSSGTWSVFSTTNITTSSNNNILTIKNAQQTESVEFTLGSDIGSWKSDGQNRPPLINITPFP